MPNTVPALVLIRRILRYDGTPESRDKESEAGKFLADNYGKTVSRRDFDAAFAKSWGKENVKAVKLTCGVTLRI